MLTYEIMKDIYDNGGANCKLQMRSGTMGHGVGNSWYLAWSPQFPEQGNDVWGTGSFAFH